MDERWPVYMIKMEESSSIILIIDQKALKEGKIMQKRKETFWRLNLINSSFSYKLDLIKSNSGMINVIYD